MIKKIIILILIGISISTTQAQQAVLAAGGEALGSGGKASYSVGQVFYTTKCANGTNADGVQQPYEFYISVDKIQGISLSMSVFPNPTSATVSLLVEDLTMTNLSFELFDMSGKFIARQNISESTTIVPMQELAAGMYFLKVSHDKDLVKTFTIIKNQQ